MGWATDRLVYHDALAPGAIRRLLTSAPAHRQSVFALVAAEIAAERHKPVIGDQLEESAIHRAEIIRDGGARDILAEVLGHEPPPGLRGALERVGPALLREPRLYQRLIEIYCNPEHHTASQALRYVGQITAAMLDIVEMLPVSLIHPNVLKRLGSLEEARGFIEAVAFARSANTRASDATIHYALAHMQAKTSLDGVLARFVRRADRLLGVPLAADDEVQPLSSVRDMILASRKFRNCLATDHKIVGALLGRKAYAIFREQIVLEYVYLSTGVWLLVDSHARRNEGVSSELAEAARAKCFAGGVATIPQSRGHQGRFGRFGRFTDHYDPCFLNLAD